MSVPGQSVEVTLETRERPGVLPGELLEVLRVGKGPDTRRKRGMPLNRFESIAQVINGLLRRFTSSSYDIPRLVEVWSEKRSFPAFDSVLFSAQLAGSFRPGLSEERESRDPAYQGEFCIEAVFVFRSDNLVGVPGGRVR